MPFHHRTHTHTHSDWDNVGIPIHLMYASLGYTRKLEYSDIWECATPHKQWPRLGIVFFFFFFLINVIMKCTNNKILQLTQFITSKFKPLNNVVTDLDENLALRNVTNIFGYIWRQNKLICPYLCNNHSRDLRQRQRIWNPQTENAVSKIILRIK